LHAAVTGFLTASALAVLVLDAAAPAASQVAPVNVEPPTITGTPRVGEALTAQNGTWANSPTQYRYLGLRCNANGTNSARPTITGEARVGHVHIAL